MGRMPVTPEVEDEVFRCLVALGAAGGDYLDIMGMSPTLGQREVQDGLAVLEKAGRAKREPQYQGRRGRGLDKWRAVEREEP